MSQDLARVPSDVLTLKEREELTNVRRRPLMLLAWCQATIRSLAREGHISERISLRLEDHIESISQAYHGCTKIKSQPMPFSYSQLIGLLSHLYCFSVPITFITSFSYAIQHGQSAHLGSAPARLLCLLRECLAALGSSALSQDEAGPLGAQPLPRVLELAASKVAHFRCL